MFEYPPTPDVLNWLAKGRLADRHLRAIRLWVILQLLYGEQPYVGNSDIMKLSQPFRYADIRDLLYAPSHGRSDTDSAQSLSAACDETCRCQQSFRSILSQAAFDNGSLSAWKQQFVALSDLSIEQIEERLQKRPFATVHRSIRDDLRYLAANGWLLNQGQGRFYKISLDKLPKMIQPQTPTLEHLSVAQLWEIVRSLESISFVQPNLDVVIHSLWEQLTSGHSVRSEAPEKRIFIHLDYILSDTAQDQVDTLQEQIEQLWRNGGGVIAFDYWRKDNRQVMPMTVYPVCLHYARRAKYLSAYGHDPSGKLGWHNYRLDRIASPRLTLLDWDSPRIPKTLKEKYQSNALPTPAEVNNAIDAAWGFNFYLPRQLLIMRFPSSFAHWYVDKTDRHDTFESVDYQHLKKLVSENFDSCQEQSEILQILSRRSPNDAYYRAWIRLGDINIVMRLRDWRPNGEVIAPLVLREKMRSEARMELAHYE